VPFEVRLRIALARRYLADRRSGGEFARIRSSDAGFPHVHADYSRPFIDYPGQEHLGEAKRHNQRLLANRLEGTVIAPGEVFSLWRLAGRPTASAGYAEAAALKNGMLVSDVGGAICLLSTVVFNAALLAGMEIHERWCHSVDSYGERRYFELGRDAAIEYGYRDLRFRNPHPYAVRLTFQVEHHQLLAQVWAPVPRDFTVSLEVVTSLARLPGQAPCLRVSTTRRVAFGSGRTIVDAPFESVHSVPPVSQGAH
jgi:vancomycin resistance protein VanW